MLVNSFKGIRNGNPITRFRRLKERMRFRRRLDLEPGCELLHLPVLERGEFRQRRVAVRVNRNTEQDQAAEYPSKSSNDANSIIKCKGSPKGLPSSIRSNSCK